VRRFGTFTKYDYPGGTEMKQEKGQPIAMRSIYVMNGFLLTVHACLFLFFAVLDVKVMIYVNIGSILLYAADFLALRSGKMTSYILTTYFEIMIHMFLAVLCLGWDCGFQLYFIGSIAIVYYADYFSVRLGNTHIQGMVLSIGCSILYFVSFALTRSLQPFYVIDERIMNAGQVINALVVLIFCTLFFRMLAHSALYYEVELSQQANYDKLTGLANRRKLLDYLEEEYGEKRLSDQWVAIMDIDDFKKVNDVYGHNCGDFVLQTIAGIISRYSGSFKTCRWGGEEFLVEGKCTTEGKPDYRLLESIRREVEQHQFIYEKQNIHLTITIGVAKYEEGMSLDEWVDTADKKLYIGKKSGKNRMVA